MDRAKLIYRDKSVRADGSVIELKIWRLPRATKERPHALKYSLYYGKNGVRLVGYDNERGKGDHRHVRGAEHPYRFIDIDRLIADFLRDVREAGDEE